MEAPREEGTVVEELTTIIGMLDGAAARTPEQLPEAADTIERKLTRLRDRLIETQRRQSTGQSFGQSNLLEQINIAISLIVSVGFPGGGIHRDALRQTRRLLQKVISAGMAG